MSRCFGYIRVSGDGQAASGLGEDAQEKGIWQMYESLVKPQGVTMDPAHVLRDLAVTAAKFPFDKRAGGGYINAALQTGDCVIFYKIDRAFRSLMDMLITLKKWDEMGVRVYSLDFGGVQYDSTTPAGKMLAVMFGMLAEMEHDRITQRCRDRTKAAIAAGRATSGKAPYGFMITTKGAAPGDKRKHLHPDDKERWLMGELLAWSKAGHSVKAIMKHCRTNQISNPRSGKAMTEGRIYAMLDAEEVLRELEAKAGIHMGQFVTPDGILRNRNYPVYPDYVRADWHRPAKPDKSS